VRARPRGGGSEVIKTARRSVRLARRSRSAGFDDVN